MSAIEHDLAPAGHESIGAAIRAAATTGRPALVGFVTAGFPSRERFRADLAKVASAADVVEIGVPFTDPMADGMTIQRASRTRNARSCATRSARRTSASCRWSRR